MSEGDLDAIKAHLDGWSASELSEVSGITPITLITALQDDRIRGDKRAWPSVGKWHISMYEGARVIWLSHYWISVLKAARASEDIASTSAVYLYAKARLLGPVCRDWNGFLCLPRSLAEDTKRFRRLVQQAKAKRSKNKPMCRTFKNGEVSASKAAELLGIGRVAFRRYFPKWHIKHTRTKSGFYCIDVESLRLFANEVRHSRIAVHPAIRRRIEKASF